MAYILPSAAAVESTIRDGSKAEKLDGRPFALNSSITLPRGFLRRRRLVSNTDRFVGGTRMAHVRVGSKPEKLNASKFFPLCPRKQTLRYALGMSVSCQQATVKM